MTEQPPAPPPKKKLEPPPPPPIQMIVLTVGKSAGTAQEDPAVMKMTAIG
jgi:hypothetical protein